MSNSDQPDPEEELSEEEFATLLWDVYSSAKDVEELKEGIQEFDEETREEIIDEGMSIEEMEEYIQHRKNILEKLGKPYYEVELMEKIDMDAVRNLGQ